MLSLILALSLAQPFAVATPSPLSFWPATKGQFIQYCGIGRACSVYSITTTAGSGIVNTCQNAASVSWGTTVTDTAQSIYSYTGTGCVSGATERYGWSNTLGGLYSKSQFLAENGTAIFPTYSFSNDPDTGFSRSSVNRIDIITGGANWGYFSSTSGYLVGNVASAQLALSSSVGSQLTYDVHSWVADINGLRTSTTRSTSMISAASAVQLTGHNTQTASLGGESGTGRIWYAKEPEASIGAAEPWVELGGAYDAITQGRTFHLFVGIESTATPTFNPSPRVGASAVTMTIVDAAAAGTATVGTTPYVIDTRTSVTTAAAGSLSTGIASAAYARLNGGVRWCMNVGLASKTTARFWAGLSTALPGSSDTNANENVSFRQSAPAGDSNLQACSRDGATQTCTDTGVSLTTGTSLFDSLCIDCIEGGTACTYWVNGKARVRKTTNLPTVTTKLSNYWSIECTTGCASARTLYVGDSSVRVR